jgi:hypothetical protein
MSRAIYLSYLHDEQSIRAALPLGRRWPAFLLPWGAERLPFSRCRTALGEAEWWLCWRRLPRPGGGYKPAAPESLARHWQEPWLLQAEALGLAPQVLADLGGGEQCRRQLRQAGKTYISDKNLLLLWAMEKIKRQKPRQIHLVMPAKYRAAGMLPRDLLDWCCRQAGSLIFWGGCWPELELWQREAGFRTGAVIGNRPQEPGEERRQVLETLCRQTEQGVMLLDLGEGLCFSAAGRLAYRDAAFYMKGEPRRLTPAQAEVLLYCRDARLWRLLRERQAGAGRETWPAIAAAAKQAGLSIG